MELEHKANSLVPVLAQPCCIQSRDIGAEIEFHGHVVDILVDVESLLDFLVGVGIGGSLAQFVEFKEGVFGTAVLEIEGVGVDFKLVYLFVVPAEVGIDEVLVVGLAHIEHADVLSVDELMHGQIRLGVDVDTRGEDDALDGWVLETVPVVVAAIAYLERAVAQIGFFGKEGVF